MRWTEAEFRHGLRPFQGDFIKNATSLKHNLFELLNMSNWQMSLHFFARTQTHSRTFIFKLSLQKCVVNPFTRCAAGCTQLEKSRWLTLTRNGSLVTETTCPGRSCRELLCYFALLLEFHFSFDTVGMVVAFFVETPNQATKIIRRLVFGRSALFVSEGK